MTNKTDYEAWEKTPGFDVCHAMVIDRGDNTAANRLTLTDKEFFDIAYAATYPAPINGIVSEIKTKERRDGKTTYANIVINNGSGQFDGIITEANLFKKPFTMYRGSTAWSLTTETFPNRFLSIFVGEIAQVTHGRGTITLKIRPRTYKLESLVGGFDSSIETGASEPPLCIGRCFNVTGVLVDDATNKYRCNSVVTDGFKDSESRLVVRDKGVALTQPITSTVDWDHADEADGQFKGLCDLVSAPDGQVTMDVNFHRTGTHTEARLDANVRWILANYATDDYPVLEVAHPVVTTYTSHEAFELGKDDQRVYIPYELFYMLQQYDLSTQGDIDTDTLQTGDRLSGGALVRRGGPRFSKDGLIIWAMDGNGRIEQQTLSTAWELSTSGGVDNFIDIDTEWPTEFSTVSEIRDYLISDDEAGNHVLYLLHADGIIYKCGAFTTSIASANSSLTNVRDLRDFNGTNPASTSLYSSMDWNEDETKLYLLNDSAATVFQFEILTAGDLSELMPTNRGFIIPYSFVVEGKRFNRFFRMGYDGTQAYIVHGETNSTTSTHLQYSGFKNYDLPVLLFTHNQPKSLVDIDAGVSYRGATKLAKVVNDLLKCWDSEFTITKDGAIAAIQLKDPEYTPEAWETIHPLRLGDFWGNLGEHVKHVRTDRAKSKFTVLYGKNFTIQRDSDLAASVSQDDRDLYSQPHLETVATSTPAGYIDAEEIVLDTFIGGYDDTDAVLVRDNLQALREVERNHYDLQIRLSATSLLTDFGLGSIVQIGDDIAHPDFAADDKAQVIARNVNWTKNLQTLTVFK